MVNASFDIIIASFNALKYLKRCVSSIQKYTKNFNYKVTVVDSGSRDGTKEFLKNRPGISFISFKKNFGPAKAFNKAFRLTSGDFIVRLDDDSEVTPGWLEGLYTSLESQEKIGIVGVKSVFKNGDISYSDDLVRYYGVYNYTEIDRSQRDYIRSCDAVPGSGMLFRRSLVEEIGYFDEQMKYYEDTDFCLRTRMAGYRILYNGKITILHHQLDRYRNVFENQKKLFHRKWENFKEFPRKDSHPADKYNTLGLDHLVNGDCKKAFCFLEKTRSLDKRFSLPFFMAVALWGMGKKKGALTKLKALLKENPLDYRVRHFLGLIYLKKKDYEKVFRLIKKTISVKKFEDFHPELSEAVYRIAMSE